MDDNHSEKVSFESEIKENEILEKTQENLEFNKSEKSTTLDHVDGQADTFETIELMESNEISTLTTDPCITFTTETCIQEPPPEAQSDVEFSDSSSSDDSNSDSDKTDDKVIQSEEEEDGEIEEKESLCDDEETVQVSGPLKTKNESTRLPEVEPFDMNTLPESAQFSLVATILGLVDNMIVVKAKESGDEVVLDTSTVLFILSDTNENSTMMPLGRIWDVFGPVSEPFYSIRFNNFVDASQVFDKSKIGQDVFYVPDLALLVMTKPLKALKGSDASNLWDEEVGVEEMEFSDDEKEAEFKRALKKKKSGSSEKVLLDDLEIARLSSLPPSRQQTNQSGKQTRNAQFKRNKDGPKQNEGGNNQQQQSKRDNQPYQPYSTKSKPTSSLPYPEFNSRQTRSTNNYQPALTSAQNPISHPQFQPDIYQAQMGNYIMQQLQQQAIVALQNQQQQTIFDPYSQQPMQTQPQQQPFIPQFISQPLATQFIPQHQQQQHIPQPPSTQFIPQPSPNQFIPQEHQQEKQSDNQNVAQPSQMDQMRQLSALLTGIQKTNSNQQSGENSFLAKLFGASSSK